jgi:hypothetical protein
VVDLRRRIEPIRTDLAIAHPGRSIDAVCPGLPTPREPSVPAPIGQPA